MTATLASVSAPTNALMMGLVLLAIYGASGYLISGFFAIDKPG
jgi:hypothetical protein